MTCQRSSYILQRGKNLKIGSYEGGKSLVLYAALYVQKLIRVKSRSMFTKNNTLPKTESNNLSVKDQHLLSALKTNYDTFHQLNHMSLINLEQFEQLSEAYPELAECYDLTTFTQPKDAEEPIAYTRAD